MAAKTNFRGSFTALVTPFRDDAVDQHAFRLDAFVVLEHVHDHPRSHVLVFQVRRVDQDQLVRLHRQIDVLLLVLEGASASEVARVLKISEYTAQGYPGEVAFATKIPGHIVPIEVGPGHEFMIHRHGFLCATAQVQLGVGFQQSLGAGVFGGDDVVGLRAELDV